MIGLLDFGIKKIPIEYDAAPKLKKDPYGRYYINYFKFKTEREYMYFFKLWIQDASLYFDNYRKLNIVLDTTLTLIGVFPTMVDEINNYVTLSIDNISDTERVENTIQPPPPPPAPPSRLVGGSKKAQEEQKIIALEYQDKLEKYRYEMQRYDEARKSRK